jgi:predicted Zn-dependent peptidase
MDITINETFQETVVTHTCASGLRLKIVPKPKFARTYATATMRFGSKHLNHPTSDTSFPAGIAHFLEHKMFELPRRRCRKSVCRPWCDHQRVHKL